jgi:hypothetical protein
MRKLGLAMALGLVFIAGCARGPEGPVGPTGPAGSPGVSLLREYTGTITVSDTDGAHQTEILVPEIQNRRQNTFVEVYMQASGVTDIWDPVGDGYTTTAPHFQVSWTLGKVYLRRFAATDSYLIKVFENE